MIAHVNRWLDKLAEPSRFMQVMALCAILSMLSTVALGVVLFLYIDTRGGLNEGRQRDALTAAQVKRIAEDVYRLRRPPKREIRQRFEVGLRECLDFGPCRRDLSRRLRRAAPSMDSPRLLDRLPQGSPRSGPGGSTPAPRRGSTPGPGSQTPGAPAPSAPSPRPAPRPTPPRPVPAPQDLVDQVEGIVNDLLPDGVPDVRLP